LRRLSKDRPAADPASTSAYSISVSAGNEDPTSVEPQAAQQPVILALDVGTSSARALAYDAAGRAVKGLEVHRAYAVRTTADGGVVIDPKVLLETVGAVLDEITDRCRGGPPISAVACDTYWHSLLALDADGRPLTPILTWADTRSSRAAEELRRGLDADVVQRRTGCVIHSSYWPAKLLWLRQTDPETSRAARYWVGFPDYLYLQLFGRRAVSISIASGTGMLDQSRDTWDGELMSAVSVREEQLTPLADYTDRVQGLKREFAQRWPSLASIPWYLPLGDGGCNNIGSGGTGPETVVIMIGTSGAIRIARRTRSFKVARGIWTYRIDRERIVQGGALSDGGNVFAWLTQTLKTDATADLETELSSLAPDAHGLTVLPFLAGERSPDWNPHAQAAFVGMTLHTRPLDLVRASLEAVAYRFAAVQTELRRVIPAPRGMIGSGAGLLHSPAWLQIMTDVLGEPMAVSAVPEASSRGAALLVLEAMGVIEDPGALPAPLGQTYTPVPAHREIYAGAIERQRRLYQALIPDAG
jgi:gluconokinase